MNRVNVMSTNASSLVSWGEFVEALDALLAEEGELLASGLADN